MGLPLMRLDYFSWRVFLPAQVLLPVCDCDLFGLPILLYYFGEFLNEFDRRKLEIFFTLQVKLN